MRLAVKLTFTEPPKSGQMGPSVHGIRRQPVWLKSETQQCYVLLSGECRKGQQNQGPNWTHSEGPKWVLGTDGLRKNPK